MTLKTKNENKINASRQRLSNEILSGVKNWSPTCLSTIKITTDAYLTNRTHRVLAVAAHGGSKRIIKVATKGSDKVSCPLLTSLVRGRVEGIEFVRSTLDGQTVEFRRQHRRKCPRIRHQFIKPVSPEAGHTRVRDGDTAEQGKDDADEGVEEDGNLDGG